VAFGFLAWATVVVAQEAPGDEPAMDEASGRHCLGETRAKWVVRQLAGAQNNPGGGENTVRVGICVPLVTRPGPLFDLTHVEVGVVNALSPAYVNGGGYVQITPLSLLVLRAELSGVAYWSFPFPRAGYFPLSGYDAPFDDDDLPSEDGAAATGWLLRLVGVLRLRFPRDATVRVVGMSLFEAERWSIGDAGYYFNLRRDVRMARTDWVVNNEALLGLEVPVVGTMFLRMGVFDSFRTVPRARYGANQVGVFAMPWWERPASRVYDLAPFLRVGMYTGHAFRTGGFSVLGGTFVSFDLGPL
jgi:hypothetical protein